MADERWYGRCIVEVGLWAGERLYGRCIVEVG